MSHGPRYRPRRALVLALALASDREVRRGVEAAFRRPARTLINDADRRGDHMTGELTAEEPGFGRMATCTDDQGIPFGLHQPPT